MSILTNPYVFGVMIAVLTAGIMFGLQHSVDPENSDAKKKVFYKTLAAGTVSALALAYAFNRTAPISTEPFIPDPPAITSTTSA
jgi:hypothetical protein